MCLLDTLDGALMLTLYTSPFLSKDPIAILYYSIVLTAITVAVALVIGTIQLLTLILNVAGPEGAFWDGVAVAGDNHDKIGKWTCPCRVVGNGLVGMGQQAMGGGGGMRGIERGESAIRYH